MELRVNKEKIKAFLSDRLHLEFSKAEVFDTKQGVDFCGYRHFKKYVILRKSTAKRMKRRFRKLALIEDYDSKAESSIASAEGQLKHCCSYNLRKSIRLDEIKEQICGKQ